MRTLALTVLLTACGPVTVDITGATNPPATTTPGSSSTTTPKVSVTVDTFDHETAAVDVLFLLDNSASMADQAQGIVNAVSDMYTAVDGAGLDHRVGVVSTDGAGELSADMAGNLWIDAGATDGATRFGEMMTITLQANGDEVGLRTVEAALVDLAKTANAGFRRTDAQLSIAVISDEEDGSAGTPDDYADTFDALGTYDGDVTFSVIGASFALRYIDVQTELGGVFSDIANEDYQGFVEDMTDAWWSSEVYTLSATPDIATLEVYTVDGKSLVPLDASLWVYNADQNTVRFTAAAGVADGTEIEVHYTAL